MFQLYFLPLSCLLEILASNCEHFWLPIWWSSKSGKPLKRLDGKWWSWSVPFWSFKTQLELEVSKKPKPRALGENDQKADKPERHGWETSRRGDDGIDSAYWGAARIRKAEASRSVEKCLDLGFWVSIQVWRLMWGSSFDQCPWIIFLDGKRNIPRTIDPVHIALTKGMLTLLLVTEASLTLHQAMARYVSWCIPMITRLKF